MRDSPLRLFVPVPWQLERDETGTIVCGPGTKEVCDMVIGLASVMCARPRILLTPTNAGPEWDSVVMAEVMDRHIARYAPKLQRVIHLADAFNTLGEVIAVASYLQYIKQQGEEIEEVTFVVKSWHAPRLKMLVRRVFKKRGIEVPCRFVTCNVAADWKTRILREWVAYLENRFLKLPRRGY